MKCILIIYTQALTLPIPFPIIGIEKTIINNNNEKQKITISTPKPAWSINDNDAEGRGHNSCEWNDCNLVFTPIKQNKHSNQ